MSGLDISFLLQDKQKGGGLDISFLDENSGPAPGNLSRFVHFLGNTASSVGSMFEDPNSRASKLFNLARHPTTSSPNLESRYTGLPSFDEIVGQVNAVNARIDKTSDEMYNWITTTPWGKFTKDIGKGIVSPFMAAGKSVKNQGIGGSVEGLAEGMVSMITTLMQAITATTFTPDGSSRPATQEEQTSHLIDAVSIAAMIGTASTMSKVILPDVTGEGALKYLQRNSLSRFGEYVAKDAFTGGVSAGVQAGISNIGQEDYAHKVITSALAFVPIGALFGVLGARGKVKEAIGEGAKVIGESSINAADAAALNDLKIDAKTTTQESLARVDAFATGDNLIDALVHSRVDIGKGVVIPKVSVEKLSELSKLQYLDKKNHIVGPDGNVFIHPKEMEILPTHREMFEKVGYFPNEIVALEDGTTFRVKSTDSEGNINLAGISNGGKEITLSPKAISAIKRTGNSFDTQVFKKFTSKDGFFMSIVGPNVRSGELPFRVTGFDFATDPRGSIPTGHQDFATLQEATQFAEDGILPHGYPGNGTILPKGGMFERKTYTKPGEIRKGVTELSDEGYFDKMYEHFKTQGFDAVNGTQAFSDLYYKFTTDMGITSKMDSHSLLNSFYTRIQKDILGTLDTETKSSFTSAAKGIEDMSASIRKDAAESFARSASTNGMYIVPRGAGRYDIKWVDTGETYKTVGSATEGVKALSDFGTTKGPLDIDGGDGNTVPPIALSPGGNNSPPIQAYGKPIFIDDWNVSAFGQALTPVMRVFASFDEKYGTKLVPMIGEPLQRVDLGTKVLMAGKGKPLVNAFNEVLNHIKKSKIKLEGAQLVQDYLETKSLKETELPLSQLGKDFAQATSKLDTDELAEYMFEVKLMSDHAPTGSAKFERAKKSVDSMLDENGQSRYDAQITAWANNLWTNPVFATESVPNIIRHAQNLRNPTQALSRVEFAAKHMSEQPELLKLAQLLEKAHGEGEKLFSAKFRSANELKLYLGAGGDPLIDTQQATDLMSEQAVMGYVARNQLSRNPVELLSSYLHAGFRTIPTVDASLAYAGGEANKLISGKNILDQIKLDKPDALNVLLKDIPAGERQQLDGVLKSVVNQYISDMRGIPRLDARLSSVNQRIWNKQFGIDTRKAIAWTTVAAMGGRPIFALRDITSSMSFIQANHGPKFAARVMGDVITNGEHKALVDNGVLQDLNLTELLLPTEDLIAGYARLSKITSIGIKLSGQPIVYNRMAAGIYRITRDDFSKYGSEYIRSDRGKEAKAELIDKMDLDIVPKSIQDDIFLRLDSPGNGVATSADVLGRWRIRSNLNVFGAHNTPQSWQGNVGRLLGHMGSWGTNAAQTMADLGRGSGPKKWGRMARYTASQAAIYGIGYATGLDLANWLVTPLGLFGVGPIPSKGGVIQYNASQALFSNDEKKRTNAQRVIERLSPVKFNWQGKSIPEVAQLDQLYIPFGSMANDWLKGLDALNNKFGAGQALFRSIGGQLDMSNRSPLQDAMGIHPKDRRTGYLLPKK